MSTNEAKPSATRGPLQVVNHSLQEISRSLPPELQRFVMLVLVLVFACLLLEFCCSRFLHLGYPFNWPLMPRDVSFWDFEAYFDQFKRLHTAAFFQGTYILMYPAPVALCYWLFYAFQPHATVCFLSFIVCSSFLAAYFVVRALMRRNVPPGKAIGVVGLTYILAYPFWFEFKQGNTEIVVWIVVSLGIFAFANKRTWTAAALFGVAGALKFYPLIYLGLLLSKKRYRECAFGCLVAVATIVVSLYALGPSIPVAWRGTQAGLALNRQAYMLVLRPTEFGFDHSLFGVVKVALAFSEHRLGLTPYLTDSVRSLMLSCYLALVGLLGTIAYFVRIRFLPFANQLLCLSIASILFPPVSFDYTLMHLYAPWVVLTLVAFQAQREKVSVRGLLAAFTLLAIAVSPLGEFILHHERVGGQLRAIVMLAIFVVGMWTPFEEAARSKKLASS